MERKVRFLPKWHTLALFMMVMMLCFFQDAEAEITCKSCQRGNKSRVQELLLRYDTNESATGLKGEVLVHGRGAASAESQQLRCASGSADCAHDEAKSTEPGLDGNTRDLRAKAENVEDEFLNSKVSNVKISSEKKSTDAESGAQLRKRTRRNSEVKSSSSAQSEDQSSAAGRRVTRADLRWSGEERRAGGGARQEELKLNSTMFALTGDSSHNQAMVHWSGQNSSVSP